MSESYPNTEVACELVSGFTNGFHLQYQGEHVKIDSNNLKSADEWSDTFQIKIDKEIEMGRVAGLFVIPPFDNLRISPIGLVPKYSPDEFRFIHHLSYPTGESINDHNDDKLT